MQLVFVASTNPKPFKLTSTPLLNFEPYIQKFKMDEYTTIDHHIKLNSLDDEIPDFYTLIKKSIEDFCKDNGIKSFTLNGNITLNLIKKEIVEFEKLKKEKDPYCEACDIFGKIKGDKPKIPVPDLNNAFDSISVTVWKQDDKINIKTDNTNKLFDFNYYQTYDLITSKLNIPTPAIGEYYSGFSTSLVDEVLDELRTMRLEFKPEIESSNDDDKEIILNHSGNPILGRYIVVKPGASLDEIDLGGVRLKKSAVRANPYLTAAIDLRSTDEKIDEEIEKKLLALEELAEKNSKLKKTLETLQDDANKVVDALDKIKEGGNTDDEDKTSNSENIVKDERTEGTDNTIPVETNKETVNEVANNDVTSSTETGTTPESASSTESTPKEKPQESVDVVSSNTDESSASDSTIQNPDNQLDDKSSPSENKENDNEPTLSNQYHGNEDDSLEENNKDASETSEQVDEDTEQAESEKELTEEEKYIKDQLDIIKKLAEKNSKLKILLEKEKMLEELLKEQNKPKPEYKKKFIKFEVTTDNMFYGDSNYISIDELDLDDPNAIDALIITIMSKHTVPIINKEDICILINIETSAYSGKTAIRKSQSTHHAHYNGTSFTDASVGPLIYAYGPNPTSGPFGSAYNGGDGFTSHDGVYKSLHTMGYANEAHIVHHNEINVLKPDKIKYNKVTDELVIII